MANKKSLTTGISPKLETNVPAQEAEKPLEVVEVNSVEMLEAACREAESVLLDRRYFNLNEETFRRFTAILDAPPKSNPRLARLLRTKAPWDK